MPSAANQVSSKVNLSHNNISHLSDLSELAEILFPDNRNHQYTFLAMFITLKWSDRRIVPDFTDIAGQHDISQRTMERVRAKMRRLGLIDRVSRFNARYGGQEGWVLSTRFERSLRILADKIEQLKDTDTGSQDKDMLMLQYTQARREICNNAQGGQQWSDK